MNNINQNCPALMSDGRNFTDYRSKFRSHSEIMLHNNLQSSNEHRDFLQKNASSLIQLDVKLQKTKNLCPEPRFIHPDAFAHDLYWQQYKKKLGFLA